MFHFITSSWAAKWAERMFPLLSIGAATFLLCGLYFALFNSPPDYQQGESVRLMYIHVPAAWLALGVYTGMALASIGYLVWKNPVSDVIARQSAPAGAMFCALCLITGSIWGKPIWGTWWVWDARLTSMLILFFFYVGYILLCRAIDDPERRANSAACLSLIGFINVPIVKFSVDWWNTLHQPASVLRLDGPAIHPSMMLPLLLIFIGYLFYYLWALSLGVRTELNQRRQLRRKLAAL